MIEALKDDKVINELGGRFKFTALIQHRVRQLMDGARPLVDRQGRSDFEIAVQEIIEGKITYQLTGEEPAPGFKPEGVEEAVEETAAAEATTDAASATPTDEPPMNPGDMIIG
ncbi:DNA-directed RNA polymerase subunit omega [Poriferisphaera sp. WC338]|uniref:DNA-directed RNA polymerase subunit omega n=1 Tax=Poriferisphaera sp. WC338 TaxID=3425129 RepID=UPI003D819653